MRNSRLLLWAALCSALALVAGGCTTATSTLWDRREYHSAPKANIELAFSPKKQDILVRYDECLNYSTNTQRRAYWLFGSTNSSAADRRPAFVDDANVSDLDHIPIFRTGKTRERSSPTGYSAVAESISSSFVLWYHDRKIRRFTLPDYSYWGDTTAWRVALTPLSVTGDVILNASGVCMAPIAIVLYVGMTSPPGTWNFPL